MAKRTVEKERPVQPSVQEVLEKRIRTDRLGIDERTRRLPTARTYGYRGSIFCSDERNIGICRNTGQSGKKNGAKHVVRPVAHPTTGYLMDIVMPIGSYRR